VQSLACSWIDWLSTAQRIAIRIRPLHPDDIIRRGIVGIERADGFCCILPDDLAPAGALTILDSLNASRDFYERLVKRGIPEHDARYFLPIARRFHRSHLLRHGFPCSPARNTSEVSRHGNNFPMMRDNRCERSAPPRHPFGALTWLQSHRGLPSVQAPLPKRLRRRDSTDFAPGPSRVENGCMGH
jgi:hypothetical protein